MSALHFYLLAVALLIVGLFLIAAFPHESLVVLTIAVPAVIGGAIVATIYLGRVLKKQPVPRSRFFRMLVEGFFGLLFIGVWIGYLTIARILERTLANGETVPFLLPAPTPEVSAPISALIIVIVFAGGPIRFALEVFRRRRQAEATNMGREIDLDRED